MNYPMVIRLLLYVVGGLLLFALACWAFAI